MALDNSLAQGDDPTDVVVATKRLAAAADNGIRYRREDTFRETGGCLSGGSVITEFLVFSSPVACWD